MAKSAKRMEIVEDKEEDTRRERGEGERKRKERQRLENTELAVI